SEFATVVATLGVLLNPNLELYGLGGVAWVRDRLVITEAPIFNPPELWTGRQGRTGYDVGVGVAWIFAPHWNLFVEYDHMGFGTKSFRLTGINAAAGLTFAEDVKLNVDKILIGLNYRFGGPR